MIKYYSLAIVTILNLHNPIIFAQSYKNAIIIGELTGRIDRTNLSQLLNDNYYPISPNGSKIIFRIVKETSSEFILKYIDPLPQRPDEVVFRFYPSELALMAALIIDEVDFARTESAKIASDIHKSNPVVRVLHQYKPPNLVKIVAYNNSHPLLSNAKIRLALSYAINKQNILNTLLNNQANIASGPLDKQSKLYNSEFKKLNYAPKDAIQLLHSDGWDDINQDGILEKNKKDLSFTLSYEKGNLLDEQVVRMIKVDWNNIGIDVIIKPLLKNEIEEKLHAKNFEALITNLKSEESIENLEYWWGENGNGNFWNYNKTTIDRYLNLAKKADPKTKERLMQGVVNTIIQDQPVTFLFFLWLDWYFINSAKFQNFLDQDGVPRPFNEWILKQ